MNKNAALWYYLFAGIIGYIFETDIVFEESILKPRRSYFTEVSNFPPILHAPQFRQVISCY